ncbi:hypothetical protein AVEN_5966-1 [Araneus ventricosus]|uniref:Uncharacterized protein n=1 Tax=Araneus ventricosus TaxID=182803 RepID=A0A4Y2HYS3_ARAVE|nr:hypothetical protein AVEN_5966-1 [Araneus ventricosus]
MYIPLLWAKGCGHTSGFSQPLLEVIRRIMKRMAGHTWLFSPSWEVRPVHSGGCRAWIYIARRIHSTSDLFVRFAAHRRFLLYFRVVEGRIFKWATAYPDIKKSLSKRFWKPCRRQG